MEMSNNQIPKNVDEYINSLTPKSIKVLTEIRNIIKNELPEAEEVYSYRMPAFKYHGMVVWYNTFANHYSIFVTPKTIEAFKNDLSDYKISKSTIQFSYDKPIPKELIIKMVLFAAQTNLEKAVSKKKK